MIHVLQIGRGFFAIIQHQVMDSCMYKNCMLLTFNFYLYFILKVLKMPMVVLVSLCVVYCWGLLLFFHCTHDEIVSSRLAYIFRNKICSLKSIYEVVSRLYKYCFLCYNYTVLSYYLFNSVSN